MAAPLIIQGEDRNINITIIDSESNVAIDLTNINSIAGSDITLQLPNTSGGKVEFKKSASEISIVSATQGKIQVTMTDIKTADIKTGTIDGQLILDFGAPTGGEIRIIKIAKMFLVEAKYTWSI